MLFIYSRNIVYAHINRLLIAETLGKCQNNKDLNGKMPAGAESHCVKEPVGELDLASSGPFFARLHPAVSTIKPTSPASPSLPDKKIARSRADDGILRHTPRPVNTV